MPGAAVRAFPVGAAQPAWRQKNGAGWVPVALTLERLAADGELELKRPARRCGGSGGASSWASLSRMPLTHRSAG